MKVSKVKKLERAGFKVGTLQEFLQLSDSEMALIEIKVKLVALLRESRVRSGLSQSELGKLMASSQSRVAKIEAGNPDVTLDLICKALFCLGVSPQSLARKIGARKAA